MDRLSNDGLKAILHSKRANIYYIEHCRVMVNAGRVVFLTEAKSGNQYWNIPIANTTVVMLGTGTSLTQAAVRMLASAGVMIGFSGGGGTPLLAATEIEWLSPQSEYRPTEYVQSWMSFWFDDAKRLSAAKQFQHARLGFLNRVWTRDREFQIEGFDAKVPEIADALVRAGAKIDAAPKVADLLQAEAHLTKQLYKFASNRTQYHDFVRERDADDTANQFLNHGNYLAYGLAATTLWVLGIPHGFAVMHGKTRRGALVFDVADLIKDALILPLAFICAKEGTTEQAFRQQCLQAFTDHGALDFMFDEVKRVCGSHGMDSNSVANDSLQ